MSVFELIQTQRLSEKYLQSMQVSTPTVFEPASPVCLHLVSFSQGLLLTAQMSVLQMKEGAEIAGGSLCAQGDYLPCLESYFAQKTDGKLVAGTGIHDTVAADALLQFVAKSPAWGSALRLNAVKGKRYAHIIVFAWESNDSIDFRPIAVGTNLPMTGKTLYQAMLTARDADATKNPGFWPAFSTLPI